MPAPREHPADDLAPGERIGPYRLVSLLGQGLMGVVFRAIRDPDGDSVALKILRAEIADDELYRRRFEREARIASELEHKNVVPVVDFGLASGRLYLAARYIRGGSLSERIASQGPLSVPETLRLAGELANALNALHSRDLVHRDVKPANVMLNENGGPVLTDFGLARGLADTVLTKAGVAVGTVDYMAPELIRGEGAGRSSDIYAFGCLLYECLAGTAPFADKNYVETLLAHINEEPPNLSAYRADVSGEIRCAVERALAKEPDARPGTAVAYARIMRASAAAR